MSHLEIKVLRDEIAKLITGNKKKDTIFADMFANMSKIIEEQKLEIIETKLTNKVASSYEIL